ncbi:MAG: hypothetical protein JSS23_11195 [Proteobacteria bacterium]|nr:hypothetical protein [Pseudomonadota bacterium]
MADDCLTQKVQMGEVSNTGTNGVSLSTPHITQVRVPKRDDGRWMMLGSVIGSVIGRLINDDIIDKAEDAEDTWKDLTDQMKQHGLDEWAHAALIKQCDDDLWERYCTYALCGYTPDYAGILSRARADAALVMTTKYAEAARTARRYNTGLNANVALDLLRTEAIAVVGAATVARENERQMMWKVNFDLTRQAAVDFETAYRQRIMLGADIVASAGQNYAFLAESLRRTAEKSTSDWGLFGTTLTVLIGLLTSSGCPWDSDCGCSGDSGSGGS